jgi:hypothetical protein
MIEIFPFIFLSVFWGIQANFDLVLKIIQHFFLTKKIIISVFGYPPLFKPGLGSPRKESGENNNNNNKLFI